MSFYEPGLDRDTIDKIISTFKFISQDNIASNWKIYKNDEYAFEIAYPKDILFATNQSDSAPILSSFSNTNIEESPVADLNIYANDIKTSPYEDSKEAVQNYSKYYSTTKGPDKITIAGYDDVYAVSFSGLAGVVHLYFFSGVVIKFSYATPSAEKKFEELEETIINEQLEFITE